MVGKKGHSGRPPGTLSWYQNATARCGHQLNALIELWLAGVPIQIAPERWLVQPTERRYTVPPKIKHVLALTAIRQVVFNEIELEQDPGVLTTDVDKVLRHIQDDEPDLRQTPGVVVIDVDKVLAWSRRRAPSGPSLRRKVRGPDAYDQYVQYVARISNAWRSPEPDMKSRRLI